MAFIRLKTDNYLAVTSTGKMFEIEAENIERAKEKLSEILKRRNMECEVTIAKIPSCISVIS